ncbi:50S ribosomal protein L35ae [Vulcanisaeta distributa]|uniref:Large ribosomal subunit protein eL33 n=1 Tax=Vulcanisaeta distributa (strain DSM 14429 / JCM 11212 / NBRC 100878 / IC-017) TaxID=572478 RepID=E1QPA5_VULDI|nr:50S ribosomal protein L35ae [Vulcanisaeta distributa]ADN50276.1 50S ribosomal protein L35Ae [Vulcanisaeta distributa DSM 14429]
MSTQIRTIKARIYSIRRGSIGYSRDAIIIVPGIETAIDAAKFINAKVIWRSKTGAEIIGSVLKVWGKHGQLLVRFRRGLPGQALGDTVDLIL